ncbi:MAG TPA: hypothetical protein VGB77_06120, partial [Abditibacteriaceae bacterium]
MSLCLLCGLFSFLSSKSSTQSKGTYSGKPWRSLKGFNLEAAHVEFSPDGKWLAGAGQNQIWRTVKTNGKVRKLQDSAYSTKVWDAATWKLIKTLPLKDSGDIAFSSDGKWLAVLSQMRVTIHQTTDWKIIAGVGVPTSKNGLGLLTDIQFSPQDDVLAIGSHLISTTTWLPLRQVTTTSDVNSVAFSNDGKTLVTGGWDGVVQVWDWITGKELSRLQHAKASTKVQISPDGKLLATACFNHSAAKLWDISTGQAVQSFKGGSDSLTPLGIVTMGVDAIAFSPDKKSFVTESGDAMRIWDIKSGQIFHTFHGVSGRLSA